MAEGRERGEMAGKAVTAIREAPGGEAERSLVAGLREGSEGARGEFGRRYGPMLHRFAAALLAGDEQLAEDVVIQTLAAGVQDIRRFNPRRSTLGTWLYGIARRRVQGELRRQGRRKSVPGWAQVRLESAVGVADGMDVEGDCTARVAAQRKVQEMARALTGLEFEVLVLKCVEELTAGEIARIVGRSERAVRSLLHRARRKVRERVMSDEG